MKSKKQQNSDNQQQQQPPICRKCNEQQQIDNTFRFTLGSQWPICQKCFYPQIQQIIPGLYLGNEDAAMDLQTIQKYKIRAVCICGSFLLTGFQNIKMQGQFDDVLYIKYDLGDFLDQKIVHLFDSNNDWINNRLKQGRNVLVHCAAGVSRSSSFVIAYVMKQMNLPYQQAYKFVKSKRNAINPNKGFQKQLQQYSNELQCKVIRKYKV